MGLASFSLVIYEQGGAVVLRFAGEYELQSAPAVADRVAEVEAASPSTIVLDLSRVTFVDSTALGQLVGIAKRARGTRRVVLIRPPHPVSRVLEVTMLDRAFEIADDLEAALAAPPRHGAD